MRNAFIAHPKYPYIELPDGEWDFEKSKIWIADAVPVETAAWPMVVVSALAGDDERYLGDDYADIIDPTVGGLTITNTINFTSIPMSLTIKIYTRDAIVRDDLQSAVYDTLKINKNVLAVNGAEISNTHWAPDGREYIFDRWWHTSTINCDIYAEWSNSTPIDLVVSNVALTNVYLSGSSTSEF